MARETAAIYDRAVRREGNAVLTGAAAARPP
jgi:hypothetical protein